MIIQVCGHPHFTFDSSRPQHGEMLQRLCKTRGVLTVRIATAIQ